MNSNLSSDLKKLLEQHQSLFETTMHPYVAIKLAELPVCHPWQSKVGGFPYLPKGVDYPVEDTDQPLQLLAQINFAEIPPLPDFPEQGILQFYIDPEDDVFGANFNDLSSRERFQVVYFPTAETNVANLVTDFSFVPNFEDSPVNGEASMIFERKMARLPACDYRFDKKFEDIFWLDDEELDELRDEYYETFSLAGHRVGGYPCFTQTDPRELNESYRQYDVLLFQLNSEHPSDWRQQNFELMWGDMGIANFFITSQALNRLDFSEILFSWDCC